MTHEPTTTATRLPKDCSWTDPNDPTWPTPENPDRILTYTDTLRTLVCCPLSSLPLIERASPHFTTCTVRTDATATDIAAALDAIETHWEPIHPCYYGVRHGHIQAYGRGPNQFHATLTEPMEAGILPSTPTDQPIEPHQVGSVCWPSKFGWIILEATRTHVTEDSTFHLSVGLLMDGALTRPETVEPVFETLGESLPRTHHTWPLRQFTLQGKKQPLDRVESVDEATFGEPAEHHILRYHGSNPLYGTHADDLPTPPTTLKPFVYDPLSQVSTLVYRANTSRPDLGLGLDSITVVESPMRHTLFVAGTLRLAT